MEICFDLSFVRNERSIQSVSVIRKWVSYKIWPQEALKRIVIMSFKLRRERPVLIWNLLRERSYGMSVRVFVVGDADGDVARRRRQHFWRFVITARGDLRRGFDLSRGRALREKFVVGRRRLLGIVEPSTFEQNFSSDEIAFLLLLLMSIPNRLLQKRGERKIDVLFCRVQVPLRRELGQRVDHGLVWKSKTKVTSSCWTV